MNDKLPILLTYRLIRLNRRLVFDIINQAPSTIYTGPDDGNYYKFIARNGYEVISRSRMDIQTERIWLLGAKANVDDRAGTMVFDDNNKRDVAYAGFTQALTEWAASHFGQCVNVDALPSTPSRSGTVTMRPCEFRHGIGWYIDHPDFYCDVEREENGRWSVFFREHATKSEGYGEQQ